MSNLSEVISEMRNMRESYDQIGAAAEAYNTGKVQLAQNITSKGVPASASETLPELAEKVSAIAQESYTIQGGEMYAKQLFGSLETPNYWNLYDVLTQLLSDGRLVNYGGILLAEYYRGYDSLALSGAGAGGAYVVSDKDGNGQFKMYTEDTTHTWDKEYDGKGNRWVAYCFMDEYHDFQITDTNTSPRSIFIGRKVGTITSLVNGHVSQIVVPDGNKLRSLRNNSKTQNFRKDLVLKNIEEINLSNAPAIVDASIETAYLEVERIIQDAAASTVLFDCANLKSVIIICSENIELQTSRDAYRICLVKRSPKFIFVKANRIHGFCITEPSESPDTLVYSCRDMDLSQDGVIKSPASHVIFKHSDYEGGDVTWKTIGFAYYPNETIDVELQNGWYKNFTTNQNQTEETMYAHILQRLKQDEPDCGDGVTITLGSTNLAKLTSDESVQLLDDLTNIYGYTFA